MNGDEGKADWIGVDMAEPTGVEWLADELKDVTPVDFLIELRRIADALEAPVRSKVCGEMHNAAGKPCVLNERHVGHHASADGRLHWLDEE